MKTVKILLRSLAYGVAACVIILWSSLAMGFSLSCGQLFEDRPVLNFWVGVLTIGPMILLLGFGVHLSIQDNKRQNKTP